MESTMVELPSSNEQPQQQLTPRQDRLEREILGVLRASGTRSELRDLVVQFSDLLRMQGASAERAMSALRTLGHGATPMMNARGTPAVGDSPEDRITMMLRWCLAHYERAD
jgi:hypothetical protein